MLLNQFFEKTKKAKKRTGGNLGDESITQQIQ